MITKGVVATAGNVRFWDLEVPESIILLYILEPGDAISHHDKSQLGR